MLLIGLLKLLISTGAARTRHPVLDTFGDVSHRWVLRQLRKLRDAQRTLGAIGVDGLRE